MRKKPFFCIGINCWDRFPAFYYGIACLSGVALHGGFWPPMLVFLSGNNKTRIFGFLLISFFVYFESLLIISPLPDQKISLGSGYFVIEQIRPSTFGKKNSLDYRGHLTCFISGDDVYYDVPCVITDSSICLSTCRRSGNFGYVVCGKLKKINNNLYKMYVTSWSDGFAGVGHFFSLAETRLKMKSRLKQYIANNVGNRTVRSFISAISTGEVDNPVLIGELKKVGLSHILAISGFHYAYITFILGMCLNIFFNKRNTAYLLMVIVSAYFLFIGESPSLSRAWIAILIYLIGFLAYSNSSGINSLGFALMISIILDPRCVYCLGFCLSYLATFAILTINHAIELKLRSILHKREFNVIIGAGHLKKHFFILEGWLRQAIALTISINLATIPVMLYWFESFAIFGFFYNLFFTVAMIPAITMLIAGMLIPFLGPLILKATAKYSEFWLNVIYWRPGVLDLTLHVQNFGKFFTCTSIMGIVIAGIIIDERRYRLTIKTCGI